MPTTIVFPVGGFATDDDDRFRCQIADSLARWRTADTLLRTLVTNALEHGRSWEQVAAAMAVTVQEAHDWYLDQAGL